MTPLETLVFLVVAYFAVCKVLSDGWGFLRRLGGRGGSSRRSGGGGGGRAGRGGFRGYLAGAWSDAWETAGNRRRARRERRHARMAAGGPRWPRLAALGAAAGRVRASVGRWYREQGNSREFHRRGGQTTEEIRPGALDRAWDRIEQRRADRAARKANGEPGWWGRVGQRLGLVSTSPGRNSQGEPRQRPGTDPSREASLDASPRLSQPRPAGHDRSGTRPSPRPRPTESAANGSGGGHQRPHPGTPLNGQSASRDSDAATGSRPGPAPDRGPTGATPTTSTPASRHDQEGNEMEATGLSSAIAYADAQQSANQDNVGQAESFIASLQAGEVSGEAVEAANRAMELQAETAQAWAQAHGALVRHQQVQEAYAANPDAGNKQFVTAE